MWVFVDFYVRKWRLAQRRRPLLVAVVPSGFIWFFDTHALVCVVTHQNH
jgi:hypothetical protein